MTHCLDGRYSSQTITEYIGGRRAQIDFIDMIRLTIKLWETHPELLEYYRNRYRYVLVDEFQVALSSILLLLSRKSLHSSVSVPPPHTGYKPAAIRAGAQADRAHGAAHGGGRRRSVHLQIPGAARLNAWTV
jgi:hypothetical protein